MSSSCEYVSGGKGEGRLGELVGGAGWVGWPSKEGEADAVQY